MMQCDPLFAVVYFITYKLTGNGHVFNVWFNLSSLHICGTVALLDVFYVLASDGYLVK